jgi:hypothetical protein
MFSIVFSHMLSAFYQPDPAVIRHRTLQLLGYFGLISGVMLVTQWMQPFLFSVAGEKLTVRLRRQAYTALMRQDMGFYDDEVRQSSCSCVCASVRVQHVVAV